MNEDQWNKTERLYRERVEAMDKQIDRLYALLEKGFDREKWIQEQIEKTIEPRS